MESWRTVWREGFAPILSDKALAELADALRCDDKRLLQGQTTAPPPLMCVHDWENEGGCMLGYAGWKGEGLTTVGEVEQFFARKCHEADVRLGEAAGCRWFLNWFDDTPRGEMRAELLPEVEREIARRAEAPAPDPFVTV